MDRVHTMVDTIRVKNTHAVHSHSNSQWLRCVHFHLSFHLSHKETETNWVDFFVWFETVRPLIGTVFSLKTPAGYSFCFAFRPGYDKLKEEGSLFTCKWPRFVLEFSSESLQSDWLARWYYIAGQSFSSTTTCFFFESHFRKLSVSASSCLSSSSGGEGPEMESVGNPKWLFCSSREMLSTLLAFLQSLETEPCLLKNSLGSRPGPLFDTKMAELMRGLCFRPAGFGSFTNNSRY